MNNVVDHMSRAIYFNLSDSYILFDFGTFSLMIYYAQQLDFDNGKLLFDATSSEYRYRIDYNLPTEGLVDSDYTVHFVLSEIQQVIGFIENQLIPNLNSEQQGLLEKYGGIENFINLNINSTDYFNYIYIDDGEIFDDDPSSVANCANVLKEFLQSALDQGQAYTVIVR